MKILIIGLIRCYQWVISPILQYICGLGSGCRFEPSCSEYCIQAICKLGWLKGGLLGAKRLCRCHPWGAFGYDPVIETRNVEREARK